MRKIAPGGGALFRANIVYDRRTCSPSAQFTGLVLRPQVEWRAPGAHEAGLPLSLEFNVFFISL